jgi:hypothetical protein
VHSYNDILWGNQRIKMCTATMISRASALEDVCKLPLILKAVPRLELLDQGNLTSSLRVAQAAVATGCVNLAYCLRNPTDTNPAHAPSPVCIADHLCVDLAPCKAYCDLTFLIAKHVMS